MSAIDDARARLQAAAAATNTGTAASDEANGQAAQPKEPPQTSIEGVQVLAAPPLNPNPQPIATAADVTGVKALDSGMQVIAQAATPLGQESPQPTSFLDGLKSKVETEWGKLTRVFQHVYAGANTILPDGEKITFGGPLGGTGTFVTTDPDHINFLSKLAKTPGSQISEIVHTAEGRDVPVAADNQFQQDQAQVRADAAKNTATDLDPNVVAARANLGSSIAQG